MRQGKREWTPEESEKLKALVRTGASPFRASVALSRSIMQVKKKAREVGCPFPHLRDVKARTREILAGEGRYPSSPNRSAQPVSRDAGTFNVTPRCGQTMNFPRGGIQ